MAKPTWSKGTRDKQEYTGIRLPPSILAEIESEETSQGNGSKKNIRLSRKELRKQHRQEKKTPRIQITRKSVEKEFGDYFGRFDDEPSTYEEKFVDSPRDALLKMKKVDNKTKVEFGEKAEIKKNKERTKQDNESDMDNDEEMTADDTYAALKKLKDIKSKKPVLETERRKSAEKIKKKLKSQSDVEDREEMTADDTWVALHKLKEAKSKKPASKTTASESKKRKRESVTKKHNKKRQISQGDVMMLAKDELEMDYYAKKLRLKSMRLPKLAGGDDGLDDLLGDLDFDKFASGSSEDDEKYDIESENNSEDGVDLDGDYAEFEDVKTDHDENDYGSGDYNDYDEVDEDEDEKPVRENPYVAPVPSKYVPPSRRMAVQVESRESEEIITLRRQTKGLLNRLAESNIGTVVSEIESFYLGHPRATLNQVITQVIIESIMMQGNLLESFLIIHAVLVTALYRTVGVEFGASFVQTSIETFDKQLENNGSGKEAVNLLSLIAELYTFQLVSCQLIYDLVRQFLTDIDEGKTELLLKIIRNCGPQLRTDDPSSLKDIIYLLQVSVSNAEPSTINSRTKFLIECITALKNNRQKAVSEITVATTQRMKKFLGTVNGRVHDPLRVSLDDIRNVEKRGKWWIVGAAWNNNSDQADGANGKDIDVNAMHDILDSAEPNWVELARKQRMNTDVRRAIFVAVMSSEDYADACDRLNKLQLKNKQEREIPRVLLHCCSQEEVYNPFYSLVASRLCGQHSLKKTFQFCLWDFLSSLEGDEVDNEDIKQSDSDMVLRKTMHMARFYAHIVGDGNMNLDILKHVNFLTPGSEIKIFLELFFVTLFQTLGKLAESGDDKMKKVGFGSAMFDTRRDEKSLIQLLAKASDQSVLKGVQYFQQFVIKSSILDSAKPKQVKRVQWGSALTKDVIKELLQRS